jgi:hypothetical protein
MFQKGLRENLAATFLLLTEEIIAGLSIGVQNLLILCRNQESSDSL